MLEEQFDRASRKISEWLGKPIAFVGAVVVVLIWAALGPYFEWSDTHQLIINTGTTIATFWMVFLLQASQNRETRALHLKLDELIKATEGARNELVILEDLDAKTLDDMKQQIVDETRD